MTKAEFGAETQRWYSGAGRLDDLTPERLNVLWELYGHIQLNIWRNAVSKALLEPRWPTAERMDALVGKAEDNEETRVQRERNLEAQRAARGGRGYVGFVGAIRPSSEYADACKRITLAVMDQHLTPRQTAGLLELEAPDGVLHGQDVRAWREALIEAGDEWARFHFRPGMVVEDARAPKLELGG